MYNLVVSLLDISYYRRSDKYRKIEKFSMDLLINEVCKSMGIKTAKQGIALCIKKNEALEFWGDKEGIKTILINLIDNGIKYSKEHGSVFISSFRPPKKEVHLNYRVRLIGRVALRHLFKDHTKSVSATLHTHQELFLYLSIFF